MLLIRVFVLVPPKAHVQLFRGWKGLLEYLKSLIKFIFGKDHEICAISFLILGIINALKTVVFLLSPEFAHSSLPLILNHSLLHLLRLLNLQ